jgi:hypothetical protein
MIVTLQRPESEKELGESGGSGDAFSQTKAVRRQNLFLYFGRVERAVVLEDKVLQVSCLLWADKSQIFRAWQ